MKCSEVLQILPSFLANEVTPSERKLIQNHLAACADCQNEMRILTALQSQIRESLHNRAAETAPSPQAWIRLKERLDSPAGDHQTLLPARHKARQQNQYRGVFAMKRIALTALVVLVLLAGTAAALPGVRAAVLENVKGWFGYDFTSPNTILSLGTIWGFSPYNPRYMPVGLEIKGTMTGGDQTTETLGLCYQPEHREKDDKFIAIIQDHLDEPQSLPAGSEVAFEGITGSIDELPEGEIQWCLGPSIEEVLVPVPAGQESGAPDQYPPSVPLYYSKALRLTYFVEDIKIEIFGPYSEDVLVRIARSMQQANLAAQQPEQPVSQP